MDWNDNMDEAPRDGTVIEFTNCVMRANGKGIGRAIFGEYTLSYGETKTGWHTEQTMSLVSPDDPSRATCMPDLWRLAEAK